ncbi:Cyanophycin synthetase [Halomonas lysinitropha]|uniref:Cyanophycin synthetase n=2 Tax=Halomonas lysinitropha TaxID=2607506 RepID=A0A5K1I1I8_9GAMM|nr:Cyanophycin synthetase [Halomonas lysinitropha]
MCIPTFTGSAGPLVGLLQWLLALVELHRGTESSEEYLARLPDLQKQLQQTNAFGTNVPRFVRAAFEMRIPFSGLPGQIIQYGQGRRARWMESSFTDETPQIAAQIARNKPLASQVLRQAGIKVPDHGVVDKIESALYVAHQLGYPVVVKPADQDGGAGVAAGLESDDDVRRAFQQAASHSRNILVEKHVEGNDYRVTVFQNEVIWAIERRPGGVTGDGRHRIEELIEQFNADPRRANRIHAPLKRLVLDEEAFAMLRRVGLDEHSIPDKDRFVRLRSASNIASGGTPVAVFDDVHPDNRQLAVRAAAALRLDLAGIDLLMPDISRSWKATGAAVCEVNGQPNLGQTTAAHLYEPLLRRLVPGSGRVPVAMILGATPNDSLVKEMETELLGRDLVPGCHDATGVWVENDTLMQGAVDGFSAGQALVRDRRPSAVVMSILDIYMLRTGLPVPRFDLLVIAGSQLQVPRGADDNQRKRWLYELLALLLPACDGEVITVADSGLDIEGLSHLTKATWLREPLEYGAAVRRAAEVLTKADVAYSHSPNA